MCFVVVHTVHVGTAVDMVVVAVAPAIAAASCWSVKSFVARDVGSAAGYTVSLLNQRTVVLFCCRTNVLATVVRRVVHPISSVVGRNSVCSNY